MVKHRRSPRRLLNYRSVIALVIIAVALVILFFVLRPKKTVSTIPSTNPSSSSKAASQAPSSQSGTASASNGNEANAGTSSKSQAAAPASSSGTLVDPYGTFVSNHSPGMNNSGTSEVSTCITTPGAQCYIELTKGNDTKKLDTETTDSSGTAYWQWDTANPKLSAGDWTITAVASLNGVTKTTQDIRPLTIQP